MSDEFGGAVDATLEHAGADAAGGLAGPKGPPASPNCLNCGTLLEGDFCHECGQSAQSLRRPFWSLLGETLETFFSLDGRIARTLPGLMLQPGRITRDYLDGQRTRFIPPFRLYVLASLIFFVLLPLVTGQGLDIGGAQSGSIKDARAQVEKSYAEGDLTEAEYKEALDGLDEVEAMWKGGIPGLIPDAPGEPGAEPGTDPGTEPGTEPGTGAETAPDAEPSIPEEEWAGFMPKSALDAVREAGAEGDEDAARFAEMMDNPDRLAEKTQEWIPRMMFVLLPVYALLLALVYFWRRRFFFFDHLIVSLHFHSALFVAMSVGFLASFLIGMDWVVLALLIYSNWYLYRMQRVVYQRSAFTSLLRVLTLDSIYFCVLLSGLLMAVILGALSI